VKEAPLPVQTVWLVGFVVIAGEVFTVRVAAVVVSVPQVAVKTARYWLPFCPAAAVKVSVVDMAPGTSPNVAPPLVLTCHCTVGVGIPLAAAVKETLLPAHTVWSEGFVVIAGATFTVSVAAVVMAVLQVLVNTARY
jgi:hypothetical protein